MHSPSLRTSLIAVACGAAALLLVPLVAMQFTPEVDWSIGDFVAAGMLLTAAGTSYVLAARRARTTRQRRVIAAGVLLGLALIWAELAVGILR